MSPPHDLERFLDLLPREAPELSVIVGLCTRELSPTGERGFSPGAGLGGNCVLAVELNRRDADHEPGRDWRRPSVVIAPARPRREDEKRKDGHRMTHLSNPTSSIGALATSVCIARRRCIGECFEGRSRIKTRSDNGSRSRGGSIQRIQRQRRSLHRPCTPRPQDCSKDWLRTQRESGNRTPSSRRSYRTRRGSTAHMVGTSVGARRSSRFWRPRTSLHVGIGRLNEAGDRRRIDILSGSELDVPHVLAGAFQQTGGIFELGTTKEPDVDVGRERVHVREGGVPDARGRVTVVEQLTQVVTTTPHDVEPTSGDGAEVTRVGLKPGVDGRVARHCAREAKDLIRAGVHTWRFARVSSMSTEGHRPHRRLLRSARARCLRPGLPARSWALATAPLCNLPCTRFCNLS